MFRVDDNVRQKVYQMFGKTEQEVNAEVKEVKKWLETQPHLPEIMEDVKIRNFLQITKFNTEVAKQRIDAYYTLRNQMPDIFRDANPKLPNIQKVFETHYCSTHPAAVDGLHRVYIIKPRDSEAFDARSLIKFNLCITEMRLYEDCMVDEIYVVDMENISFKNVISVTPKFIFNIFKIYKDVYSLRLNGLYFLNSPFYVSAWLALMKLFLKPKIYNRVKVCKDTEAIKELFSMEDLPKDYGGNGPSLDDLREMVRGKFKEYQDRFDKMDTLTVDESLRPKK